MTTKGNPKLQIRMTELRRTQLVVAARNAGTDASTVVNQLIDWWMGVPGAELPVRPVDADPN